jgi:phage recombination protein Bet
MMGKELKSQSLAVVEDMTLMQKLGHKFEIDKTVDLDTTLRKTVFRSDKEITPEQMTAILVVANQYGLNPFTGEIFAFPSKGGIVPVVGVDGWIRIINDHPQCDGIDFKQTEKECTCRIHRKDRKHPVTVTEYFSECRRDTSPWKSHPRRMLRHKALIQCARIAFGFGGIYDQDEAERIDEKDITPEVEIEMPVATVLSVKTEEEVEKIDKDVKELEAASIPVEHTGEPEVDIFDKKISLIERISRCVTLEQVKYLEPELHKLDEGEEKQNVLAAGKAKFKSIKAEMETS